MTIDSPDLPAAGSQLQDLWFRVALSPVFGFAVPTFSGLIDFSRHTTGGLIGAYAAYSVVAFVVWEGNRRLHFALSRRDDFLERPWHRARLLFTVIVLFTIPVSTALLLAIGWGNEGERFVVRIPLKAEGRRLKAASSPHRPAEPDGDEAQQH